MRRPASAARAGSGSRVKTSCGSLASEVADGRRSRRRAAIRAETMLAIHTPATIDAHGAVAAPACIARPSHVDATMLETMRMTANQRMQPSVYPHVTTRNSRTGARATKAGRIHAPCIRLPRLSRATAPVPPGPAGSALLRREAAVGDDLGAGYVGDASDLSGRRRTGKGPRWGILSAFAGKGRLFRLSASAYSPAASGWSGPESGSRPRLPGFPPPASRARSCAARTTGPVRTPGRAP